MNAFGEIVLLSESTGITPSWLASYIIACGFFQLMW